MSGSKILIIITIAITIALLFWLWGCTVTPGVQATPTSAPHTDITSQTATDAEVRGVTRLRLRFLISAVVILILVWIGARIVILLLQTYVPKGQPVGILLESLYSIVLSVALYQIMRPNAAEYGLSLGTLPKKPTLIVLAGYITVVITLLLWRIGSTWFQPLDLSARTTQVSRALGFYWLTVCVVPVFEELLFRGLLQTWACLAFPGGVGRGEVLSWGTLVAAALFGLFHLPFLWPNPATRTWFSVGASFVAGTILGIIRDRIGSVYPAMLLHSMGNLTGF